jgi:hypothetical protein
VCYGASHQYLLFLLLFSPFLSLFLSPSPSPNLFQRILFSLTDTLMETVFVVFSYYVTERHGQCFAGQPFSCKSVSDHISCSDIETLKAESLLHIYKCSSYLNENKLHHRHRGDKLDNAVWEKTSMFTVRTIQHLQILYTYSMDRMQNFKYIKVGGTYSNH